MAILGARQRSVLPGWRESSGPLLALAAGTVIVGAMRWGPDWPAQEFRAWLAIRHGLVAWTGQWYGGEPVVGYSVLYPVVSGVLGASGTGLVAVVVAAWAASALPPPGRRSVGYQVAVAIALSSSLLVGQVPFLLGVAFATLALRRLVAGPGGGMAVVGYAACSALASPLAGASLVVAAPALAVLVSRPARAWLLCAAAIGPVASLLAGGAQGPFPFPATSLLGAAACCGLATLAAVRFGWRALAVYAGCVLAVAVLCFFVTSPVGANILRAPKLAALPLAALCRPGAGTVRPVPRRAGLVAAVAVASLWQGVPTMIASGFGGTDDPTRSAGYYRQLIVRLEAAGARRSRVEIVPTRGHWETSFVARAVPLARGWDRQTDLQYNAVLYRDRLSAAQYRQWLDDNAVGFVALPRTTSLDQGGGAERELLAHPPKYLAPLWRNTDWQVWRVRRPQPLVSGAAGLVGVRSEALSVHFTRPGWATVRVRGGEMWRVASGNACVAPSSLGWLQVHARRSSVVALSAGLSLPADDNDCSPRTPG